MELEYKYKPLSAFQRQHHYTKQLIGQILLMETANGNPLELN